LVTKVDYANETLSFYHPDSFSYQGEGRVLSSPISQSDFFELPVSIDGEHGGRWMLDLGAGGMSFHYSYAEEHGLFNLPGVDGLGHGAGGSSPRRRVLFDSIEFAGHTLPKSVVSMPLERGGGGFGHTDLTGNIGNTLLRHFVLYLDYQREQVIVEKGDDFDRVFPRDNSGLQLANVENDRLEVIFVADNTPAAEAGFEMGDILTAVNEIEIEHLGGIVAVVKLLRKSPGTKLSVEVSRGGEAKKVSLTLRDLYL
ncbi:MAG: PDZ domain-containing protein, partial [candidate division Zixibacteria bacterium]|nr:PDZ domain-containing protein [candidate division Zixibacteria bacterium]